MTLPCRTLAVAVVCWWIGVTAAFAQGGVLPGVSIDVHSGAAEFGATTGEDGTYRLEGVPAGAAEVTFKLINFTVVRRDVMVGSTPAVADAVLTVSLNADIVVTGTRTF